MQKLTELSDMLKNDGLSCEILEAAHRTTLQCTWKGCQFTINDRDTSDKYQVNPIWLRSSDNAQFPIDVPSVNIAKDKVTAVIYKELHKRFIAEFCHQAEISLKKLKEHEAFNSEAADKKRVLAEFMGTDHVDLTRQINTTVFNDHYIKYNVGANIELSISSLTLEQALKILEVIK